jgi:5-methylcytosine-specific restriction protein B
MEIKDYLKKYNLPFDKVKNDFKEDFDSLYSTEKEWFENLEDKIHLLKNKDSEDAIRQVIQKLKGTESFTESDTTILSTFIGKINTIVRIANRINNFKEGMRLDKGILRLYDFFNTIKRSDSLQNFNSQLNNNLLNFLPHIFSVIKHCQNPIEYPIYYKYWKNILREVLFKDDSYDSMCTFYRTFPSDNRHINFATYLGVIGIQIAKNINDSGIKITKDSKNYEYLTNDVINIERYNTILDNQLFIIKDKQNMSKKYWLYAPGEGAEMWDEFYELGIMGLGWDKLGDLNNYKTKDEIVKKLQKIESTQSSKKNDATANFEFKNEISVDDVVIVKTGRRELLGYGIIKSDYYYDNSREYYKHCRKVEWKKKGNWEADHSLVLKTLTDISEYPSGLNQYNFYYQRLLGLMNDIPSDKINYKEQYSNWLNSTNKEGSKKPGSYIRAIEILSEITHKEIFEEDEMTVLNVLYQDLLNEQGKTDGKYYSEQAPSYGSSKFYSAAIKSYSDFIAQLSKTQILKTHLISNMPLNSILYGPPGTGKTYNSIDKAVAITTGQSSDHISNKKQFDDLRKQGQIEFVTFHQNYSYEDFMVGIRPNVSETTSELNFKKHYGIFYEIAKRAKENYLSSISKTRNFENSLIKIKQIVDESKEYKIKMKTSFFYITHINSENIIGRNQSGKTYKFSIIEVLSAAKKYAKDLSLLTNARQSKAEWGYVVEELIKLSNKIEVLKKFVLIIDEINRANISKVFGELITLLEDDKRIGEPNELKITLPNGEKEFGIPPNLYIIGTMNTADKSIALIDIALRRRFEFIGKYPEYNEIKNVESKNLLKKINEEIYKLKNSADYLIGHAYFMKGQSIEETLRNKIVPLLMEYFSGKTKIVSDIFIDTNWKVEYDTTKFNWTISTR